MVKAVFENDSNLDKSISAEEEKKSSSSYSIIDSVSNSTPLQSPANVVNSSP